MLFSGKDPVPRPYTLSLSLSYSQVFVHTLAFSGMDFPSPLFTFYPSLRPSLNGVPGWLSRLSVRLQLRSDLTAREIKPRVGLRADTSEPGFCFKFCVSPLSDLLPFTLCVSLSLKNK